MARHTHLLMFIAAAVVSAAASRALSKPQSVLVYHGNAARSGNFVVPNLTWDRARSLHLDEQFHPSVMGHVYAQPLYWHPRGSRSGVLFVATESNYVHAIEAETGRELWRRSLGQPVERSQLRCGNISPLGITGTPAIDEGRRAIFMDAAVAGPSGPRHLVFALSLKDGTTLPGWPVDVVDAVARTGSRAFVARDQNQRGALAILGDTVYVPFGGHFGDCGDYRGTVLGVSISDPTQVKSWSARGRGAGIWAPGGISSAGGSLFVVTGNTLDAVTWSDGQAVFRLAPNLSRSSDKRDFFAAADWRALDDRDDDLGGTHAMPLDVPAAGRMQARLLALGKDRKAYLLDRTNLGGMGGALAVETVSTRPIRTAPASYPAPDGIFVAFQGPGARCPSSARGAGLTVLKIKAGSPPRIETAWCGALRGAGSPIVTTTDGRTNPIVWILGAEGDDRLHGFRGDTGEPLFSGPAQALSGLRHFQTLIATETRLYVAADDRLYSFAY